MLEVCWIEPRALETLREEATRWPLRETGGALLGWQEDNESVIAAVLGPGPEASHGLSHFEPDTDWQQREGERIYRESGRTVAYIGDWHSHPHGGPHPSWQDRGTARKIAEDPGFRTPEPLYAIASKHWYEFRRPDWRVRVMRVKDGSLRDTELRGLRREKTARAARSVDSSPLAAWDGAPGVEDK